MPFPNPQVLNALVDNYISKRQPDWNSFAETIKWFINIAPWSTYQGATTKKNTCDKLKNDFKAPPAKDSKEIEKWSKICIDLGDIATSTMKLNKASLIAKYLHGIRTYILSTISNSEDTQLELQEYINKVKTKSATNNGNTEVKAAEPSKEAIEKQLLELAYLGDSSSIVEARKLNLLWMYEIADASKLENRPYYFEDNYFAIKFFNENLKSDKLATFDSFENTFLVTTPVTEVKPVNIPVEVKENKESNLTVISGNEEKVVPPPVEPVVATKPTSPVRAELKVVVDPPAQSQPVNKNPEVKQESKTDKGFLPPIFSGPATAPRLLNPINSTKKIYSNFGLVIDTKESKRETEIDLNMDALDEVEEVKPVAKKSQRVAAIRGRQTVFREKAPVKIAKPEEEEGYYSQKNRRKKRYQ